MVIKNAKSLIKQRGALLVEMLVSLVLGVMAVGLVTSILVTGYRVASNNTLDLLVLQNLTITSQMMRADLQRAGYADAGSSTVMLAGASDVVEVSGASVGFVYYDPNAGEYQHIKYKVENQKLYSCEKKSVAIISLAALTDCYNMFDQDILAVKSFALSSIPLQTSGAKTTMSDLYIEAELTDGRFNHAVTTQIKQRNWL
ncbi:PilW family protein [Vibrio taketomensis]|uniref:PilW family protein n=1 Tax=Vibrio taketomensis TaxID=2572923 RepID=UPI0013898B47|nr:hypothetical protein [Vibrio taketomensis]